MTWTPKPGDKVTSPLLVGEWEVASAYTWPIGGPPEQPGWWIENAYGRRIAIGEGCLTPVVPPLPPEPAVGEVVWGGERYWQRTNLDDWYSAGLGHRLWSDIAADAVPVVPATEVAAWLRDYYGYDGMAAEAIAKFGWDKP